MKSVVSRVCMVILLAGVLPLSAGVILVTNEGGITANGLIDWGVLGPAGTTVPVPTAIGVPGIGGLNMTISLPGFSDVERRDQGTGWDGNFAPGERLLWTRNHNTGVLTLDFSSPIMGFGSQIQRDAWGTFTARIRAYDAGLSLLGSFTEPGNSSEAGDDSAIFIGVLSDLRNISRIELDTDTATQDFAINGPRIQGQGGAIPEPSTGLMLISGGMFLAACAWRRRKA